MPVAVWVILSSTLAAVVPALIAADDPILKSVGAGLSGVFAILRIWQKQPSETK